MKKSMLIILLCSFTCNCLSQFDTLTNSKVLAMQKAGVSIPVILKKITLANLYDFDLSADAIITMKSNKIHDTILFAMFERASKNDLERGNKEVSSKFISSVKTASFDKSNLDDLRGGFCYILGKDGVYLELPRLEVINPNKRTADRSNVFETPPEIVALMSAQYLMAGGEKSTLISSDPLPKIYIVLNSRAKGSDIANNVYIIKAVVKDFVRRFPFNTIEDVPKLNTYVKPTLNLIRENIIEASLDKKLTPGSYAMYIRDIPGFAFFEFDIK